MRFILVLALLLVGCDDGSQTAEETAPCTADGIATFDGAGPVALVYREHEAIQEGPLTWRSDSDADSITVSCGGPGWTVVLVRP